MYNLDFGIKTDNESKILDKWLKKYETPVNNQKKTSRRKKPKVTKKTKHT